MKIKTKLFWLKKTAFTLAVVLLTEACLPGIASALTSGPSKPEVQSFEPVTTTEMVNLFSGDFTYNIPLFELPGPNGGYPFNLHYNAGIGMDQEASWVGLGWNLNPGAITRNMQGLPDEYKNKLIQKESDIRPNRTYGATFSGDLELMGADGNKVFENPSMTLGITFKYNNYKGLGYGLDVGSEYGFGNDATSGAGLNLSLDSESGIGINTSYSLTAMDKEKDEKTHFQIGVGYSSSEGLNQYTFQGSHSKDTEGWARFFGDKDDMNLGGTSAYTVMSGGYIPPSTTPMDSRYTTLSFKPGFGMFGMFGNVTLSGFYSTQYVPDSKKNDTQLSHGYLYAQNDDGNALLDFNREKDGMLHKNSSYLPVPVATPDIFTMTSQGASSMFRAFRNDAGVYHDYTVSGQNVGGSAGIELLPHFGFDATFGYGETKVSKWTADNDADALMDFNPNLSNPGQEAYYFQTYGESTTIPKDLYNNIGGEDPVALSLDPKEDRKRKLNTTLRNQAGATVTPTSTQINTTSRAARNTPVQYLDPQRPDSGMYSINADGSMYIFGKAQKIKQNRECMYSVNGGYNKCTRHIPALPTNGNKPDYKTSNNNVDYFFNRTTLTDYAYTYLISEIRGADYVDANGDGLVNNGDKGYWVKFNYEDVYNYTTPYKYRAPYYGGSFVPGKLTTIRDDKATYSYGEKEVSYLKSVETNSHIAEFTCTKRKDGRGASGELAGTGAITEACSYSYKLEYISLRAKADPGKTLMKVYFQYSYDLCKGVLNNDGSADTHYALAQGITNNGGKLTLKKVWIEYENNTRGKMNPYKFDYHETTAAENPNYVINTFDRWGNNRVPTSTCDGLDVPYIKQFDNADPAFKSKADQTLAAWSMKALSLPSGALINVDYESDDYAYVQDKRAGQMFKMHSLDGDTTGFIQNNYFTGSGNTRKIVFKLEKPLYNTAAAADTFNTQYIEGLTKNEDGSQQLYFNLYGHLLDSKDGRNDYVSGYADVDAYGLEPLEGGKYTKGYIILKAPKVGQKTFPKYHPFAVAFWQALMTDYSEVPFTGSIDFADNESKEARRAKLNALFSIGGQFMAMFRGFYDHANKNTWGRNIDLKHSYIRLNSPDRVKLGGGLRVKKITLSDKWDAMQTVGTEALYGQVYEYTTTDSKGNVFSSGVATYEPMTGGDENSLRGASINIDKIPLKLSHNFFFETPINESYYPGAAVGYSKVTVKSLAASQNEKKQSGMTGILSSGAVCNEFYTCKDFPVKTYETPIVNVKDPLFIPMPFIGSTTDIRVTASKGYSIQLNDMHGKPKKTSVYAQGADGSINYGSPVSYIEYKYKSEKVPTGTANEEAYYTLSNQVPVLIRNSGGTIVKSNNYIVGEKIEFFTDMREQVVNTSSGGVSVNVELFPFTIAAVTIPAPWPSVSYNRTRVRTVVTNKVIHKFGIVDSIIAYNGGSTVITKNLVFDGVTGQPVLTSVTNNFDDPVFNFSLPAHMVYPDLGAAYTTVGAAFNGSLAAGYETGFGTRNKERLITVATGTGMGNGSSLVAAGDVLSIYTSSNQAYAAVVTRVTGGNIYIQTTALAAGGTNLRFYIMRPGRKNQLGAIAGSVATLGTKTTSLQYNPIDQLYATQP